MDDARLAELVGLIEFADSVELKLTVPDENRRATVAALGLDPLDALLRQVYFFDTPDLALESAGLVVRARRTQGKPDDSVVKLRPVVPQELPERVRAGKRFGIEVDAMPGGFVCSGSFKGAVKSRPVRDTVLAGGPLRKLFTKGQRAFYAEHAPDGIELDGLAVLGPVHVLKLKSSPEGYDRRLVVELWLYPDGSQILELSTKCAPEEAFDVAARSRAFLAERGVELSGEQRTKTRTALEFFAGELR
ncbi:MAG: adenylate cyclase [Thermoleophilia bacterium]|nr:adenylate cyclase [Thermoleophilia bacterium]